MYDAVRSYLQALHLVLKPLGSQLARSSSCLLSFQARPGLAQLLLCLLQGALLLLQLMLQALCTGCLLCRSSLCLLSSSSQGGSFPTQLHSLSCPPLQHPSVRSAARLSWWLQLPDHAHGPVNGSHECMRGTYSRTSHPRHLFAAEMYAWNLQWTAQAMCCLCKEILCRGSTK